MTNQDNPSVQPMTEDEIKNTQTLFDRLASTIVAHSQQVRELSSIRSQLDSISHRVSQLENENTRLREDLSTAWQSFEREKQARVQAENQAQEAVTMAQQARSETERVKQDYETRLAMSQDKTKEANEEIAILEAELERVRSERNSWRERSDRWEDLAKASEDKLATVKANLDDMSNKVRSLFEPPVHKVEPVKVEPKAQESWQTEPQTLASW